MAHPLLSTVVYLAGDAAAARLGARALWPGLLTANVCSPVETQGGAQGRRSWWTSALTTRRAPPCLRCPPAGLRLAVPDAHRCTRAPADMRGGCAVRSCGRCGGSWRCLRAAWGTAYWAPRRAAAAPRCWVNWWDHQPQVLRAHPQPLGHASALLAPTRQGHRQAPCMPQGVGQIPADVAERHGLAAGEAPCVGRDAAHRAAHSAEELPVPVLRAPEDGDSPIMVLLTALASACGCATFFLCKACMAPLCLWCTLLPPALTSFVFGSWQPVLVNIRPCRWMTSWQRTACGCWARVP